MTDSTRRLPHDIDAERALLGAAFYRTDAAEAIAAIDAGVFYRPAHGYIAHAIGTLAAGGEPIDAVTVADRLRSDGHLEAAGGPAALIELTASGGSAPPATYATIIVGHASTRRLIATFADLLDRGFGGTTDAGALLDEAHRRLEALPATIGSTLAWADLDLILAGGILPIVGTDLLVCDNGNALLYAGRVHFLWGEPSSGKGWVALTACAQVMAMGGTAVYVDYEDTDPGIVGRLLALGVAPETITARLRLVRNDGPLGAGEVADLEAATVAANADLVIIDGLAEALSHDGIDENDNIEVTGWIARVPKRIAARTGATVVIIDHVAKSKEERGRWGRGAGSKLAALDGAAYILDVREPFSRQVAGRIDLIIAKDRHGAVGPTGATAAHFHITPRAAGALVSTRLEAPTPDEAEGKPTSAMAHVSGAVDANPGISRSQLGREHRGGFHAKTIDRAIDALIASGHLRATRKGNGHALDSIRPYPDDDDTIGGRPRHLYAVEPPPPPPPTDEPLGDF